MALKITNLISDKYRERYPKVSKLLDENVEETLTFYSYPKHRHRKIRTTNLIEGTLNSTLRDVLRLLLYFLTETHVLDMHVLYLWR